MNVLIVSIEFPPGPGGVGTLTHHLARHFNQIGWQVRVATPQHHATKAEIKSFNQSRPFRVVRFTYRGPMLLEGLNRLMKVIAQVQHNRPDVLLALGWQSVWLGALVHLICGIPLVAFGIGSEFVSKDNFVLPLTRWAFAHAGLVIFVSRFTYMLALEKGFKIAQARIIPPGADDALFRPGLPTKALREQLGLNGDRILLTVGQVSERKAQDVVIRALPRILQECPNTMYLLIGSPTQREELEKLAFALGVEGHVMFIGVVEMEQLPYYYNLADVFILVSRHAEKGEVEGFGIVVLEAALCGVPAVVSRGCGLEEAVIPNKTALLVDPDDPQATAEAILRLLNDASLRQRMGQVARHYASTMGCQKRMEEYEATLREFIQSSRS